MAKQSKNYFTHETEQAILEYVACSDSLQRERIYKDRIHYAFFKLTENIIHTFKFYYTEEDSVEDLQHEVITFLLSKLHLFDPTKGAKAYSYFGTIAKRYLIMTNTKSYKKRVERASISEVQDNSNFSYEFDQGETHKDMMLSTYMDKFIEHVELNLTTLFDKDEDSCVADSIIQLFKTRNQLAVLNKKALYIYIREMHPDIKTVKITKVAKSLHDIFRKGYHKYLEQDIVVF